MDTSKSIEKNCNLVGTRSAMAVLENLPYQNTSETGDRRIRGYVAPSTQSPLLVIPQVMILMIVC